MKPNRCWAVIVGTSAVALVAMPVIVLQECFGPGRLAPEGSLAGFGIFILWLALISLPFVLLLAAGIEIRVGRFPVSSLGAWVLACATVLLVAGGLVLLILDAFSGGEPAGWGFFFVLVMEYAGLLVAFLAVGAAELITHVRRKI